MDVPGITERIQELIADLDEVRRQGAEGLIDCDGRNVSLAITALEDAESRAQRAGL